MEKMQRVIDFITDHFQCDVFYDDKGKCVGVYVLDGTGAIPVVISQKIENYLPQGEYLERRQTTRTTGEVLNQRLLPGV